MTEDAIRDHEFGLFQRLIQQLAGISLAANKKVLLVGRLQKRLEHYGLDSYLQYYHMVTDGGYPEEQQTMVDLLTTNETYFFREPQHFDFLRDEFLPRRHGKGKLRIWSAASSSGEEAYSLAMLLAEHLKGAPWEIVGSDISSRVLAAARQGHYALGRHEGIPRGFMKKYCLKGVRAQAGYFLIAPELRQRVSFRQINLIQPVDARLGQFEVIFLRNVMIYFDLPTKRQVIAHLLPHLAPGGYLIIGHSETLNEISDDVTSVRPTIYRKDTP